MIGYEILALIWFEEKDGFVRIARNTQSGSQQFWLKKSEVMGKGCRVHDYVKFATTHKPTFFPDRLGINLNFRTDHTTKSRVIATLRSDHFFVTPIGESSGMWIKVKVEKRSKRYCDGGTLVDSWTGWIKFVDDQGYPNIWYYPKGC